jgi:hypothetical protein
MFKLLSLISVLNDTPRESSDATSLQRSHKKTQAQATPSAPLQATENTDQQSPLEDDVDESEPQVCSIYMLTHVLTFR